jgi:D-amino-acid dehydrogenase
VSRVTKVVVVGAGIVGASAAYRLSRRGAEVVLVDGDDPGQATAAGAGIICPWVDHAGDDAWYGLALAGARHYPELVETLAGDGEPDAGYARVGALLVAEESSRLTPMETLLRERRPDAPDMGEVAALPSARPRDLFPLLRPDLAGIHVPGAARVDGRTIRDALLRAAQRHGTRLQAGRAVLTSTGGPVTGGPASDPDRARVRVDGTAAVADAVTGDPGRVRVEVDGTAVGADVATGDPGRVRVEVDGTVIGADVVVVAAGAWTEGLCRTLGYRLPVRPERGQIVHAELPGTRTEGWPIVLPQREGQPYLLGFPGSRVVFGATREDAGFDHRVTVGGLDDLLGAGVAVAPGLADATVVETRAGFRPATADGRPLLGTLSPGLVIATGLGAYGLTAGPYAGLVAAALALGESPPLDLSPFAPGRTP